MTGTVAPNVDGSAGHEGHRQRRRRAVNADGIVHARCSTLKPGATLITTEAVAEDGGKATDTRSVEAGELRAPGSNIENAVTTAISKQAFAKIAAAAGTMIKGMDFKPMLTPMNPMIHSGDEGGEDCLFARVLHRRLQDVERDDHDGAGRRRPVVLGASSTASMFRATRATRSPASSGSNTLRVTGVERRSSRARCSSRPTA